MLVSVNELRSYMGGWKPQPGQTEEVAAILSGVQQQLETWLNRPLEYIQLREIVRSDRMGFLYLSVTPVRKVISCGVMSAVDTPNLPTDDLVPYVMSRDVLLPEDARVLDRAYDYNNLLYRPGGMQVNMPYTWYVVEYIGGYNYYTEDGIKLAIKRVAAREVRRNFVYNSGNTDGAVDSTETGDTRQVGWTKDELTQLERYRRRIWL